MADMDKGPEATQASDGGARFMKTVVIVLGILLIAGFVLVFSTIIYRSVKLADGRGGSGGPVKLVRGELPIPAGAEVGSMVLDGNRLAIHLRRGASEEIVIIDVRRAEEISRVRLVPGNGNAPAQ